VTGSTIVGSSSRPMLSSSSSEDKSMVQGGFEAQLIAGRLTTPS
jgi:hypothetical protein